MRFPIRVDRWWRPFLLVIGATPGRSYVELDAETLHVRLGWFRYAFPRAHLVAVARSAGARLYGVGVHTNLTSTLCINGSFRGMVDIRFEPAVRVRVLGLPVRCHRLLLSMVEPDALIEALRAPAQTPGGAEVETVVAMPTAPSGPLPATPAADPHPS